MKREKCSYADKYKAMRAPTCGCITCEKKWAEKNSYDSVISNYFKDLRSKQIYDSGPKLDPNEIYDACK
jgi:hypothetical protein